MKTFLCSLAFFLLFACSDEKKEQIAVDAYKALAFQDDKLYQGRHDVLISAELAVWIQQFIRLNPANINTVLRKEVHPDLAITIGHTIFFGANMEITDALIVHEATHVKQFGSRERIVDLAREYFQEPNKNRLYEYEKEDFENGLENTGVEQSAEFMYNFYLCSHGRSRGAISCSDMQQIYDDSKGF